VLSWPAGSGSVAGCSSAQHFGIIQPGISRAMGRIQDAKVELLLRAVDPGENAPEWGEYLGRRALPVLATAPLIPVPARPGFPGRLRHPVPDHREHRDTRSFPAATDGAGEAGSRPLVRGPGMTVALRPATKSTTQKCGPGWREIILQCMDTADGQGVPDSRYRRPYAVPERLDLL
jgi:hypothetical protein